MGRRLDIVITVAGCLTAFVIGIAGVIGYATFDMARKLHR